MPSAVTSPEPATAITLVGPVTRARSEEEPASDAPKEGFIGRFDPELIPRRSDPGADGAVGLIPEPPTDLRHSIVGSFVTLTWNGPTSGPPPTTYVIQWSLVPGFPLLDTNEFETGHILTTFSTRSQVPDGTYYVRIRARNNVGTSDPSNEVKIVIGCTSPPAAPLDLTSSVNEHTVTLSWKAPPFGSLPTEYVIEAGSASGIANLAQLPTGNIATSREVQAPNGTYFVRVRARNACGSGPPSGEIVVNVAPRLPPGAPRLRTPTVVDTAVTLTWEPSTEGGPPTTYIVEISSSSDFSNVRSYSTGNTSFTVRLEAGIHFARVKATNAFGTSGPSNVEQLTLFGWPGPPTNLKASVTGTTVAFTWNAPTVGGPVKRYVIEFWSRPDDVRVADTGSALTFHSLDFHLLGHPPGAYFAQVRGVNDFGRSSASNQVSFFFADLPPGSLDGTWSGTTGQGKRITFTVSGGAVRRLEFTVTWSLLGCSVVGFNLNSTVNEPIVNNSFAFSGRDDRIPNPSYQINGTFSSATAGSGYLRYDDRIAACAGRTVAIQTTWNASK